MLHITLLFMNRLDKIVSAIFVYLTHFLLAKTSFLYPLLPEFMTWTLPSLNLGTFIVANRCFSQNQ